MRWAPSNHLLTFNLSRFPILDTTPIASFWETSAPDLQPSIFENKCYKLVIKIEAIKSAKNRREKIRFKDIIFVQGLRGWRIKITIIRIFLGKLSKFTFFSERSLRNWLSLGQTCRQFTCWIRFQNFLTFNLAWCLQSLMRLNFSSSVIYCFLTPY